jgi:beta-glucosidase-like glycosyl hydrolase
MRAESLPLIVGLPGPELDRDTLAVLERVAPAGVILFARNIVSTDQVRDLVIELEAIEPRPFVSVDLEGGVVNRLAGLWGELPAPSVAALAGRRAVRALGDASGAACRALGVHLDLAPVVDLEHPSGLVGRQGRTLSHEPERVTALARVFHEGLGGWCVEGCLKHFPGLGAVPIDTHEELPVLELDPAELDRHLTVFADLATDIPIVMVGHVVVPALGDAERPASLSRTLVDHALSLPGAPVVLSDDLEMGALSAWGDLPDRVLAALRARNHGVLVCKAFDRLEEIVEAIERATADESNFAARVSDMSARLGTLRRDLCQGAAAVPAPDDETVAQLWERARKAASL